MLFRSAPKAPEVSKIPEIPQAITFTSQSPALQSLITQTNKIISQVGTTPEIEEQVNQINRFEMEKASGVAKARMGADEEDTEKLEEGMAESKEAEESQQNVLDILLEQMKEARTTYAESFIPSGREAEVRRQLNTLRTERQLLPIELRQQGISAAGIAAGQIEDERVRAIQEQNLLIELGFEEQSREAQTKFAETKLGFIQDDIDLQMKISKQLSEAEQDIIDQARTMRKDSLSTMESIVDSLEGLAWEDLDAETQSDVITMAQGAGVPLSLLQSA